MDERTNHLLADFVVLRSPDVVDSKRHMKLGVRESGGRLVICAEDEGGHPLGDVSYDLPPE